MPARTEKQRKFMGAELARKREGKKTQTGMSEKQLEDFGGFASLTSAEEPLTRPYRVPLRPRSQGGRYYYNVFLDISTLDVSDLDELQRWLRGEFQPAVRGKTNPASALKNGIGTIISRLLGGERRHYEQRSESFTAG